MTPFHRALLAMLEGVEFSITTEELTQLLSIIDISKRYID